MEEIICHGFDFGISTRKSQLGAQGAIIGCPYLVNWSIWTMSIREKM